MSKLELEYSSWKEDGYDTLKSYLLNLLLNLSILDYRFLNILVYITDILEHLHIANIIIIKHHLTYLHVKTSINILIAYLITLKHT